MARKPSAGTAKLIQAQMQRPIVCAGVSGSKPRNLGARTPKRSLSQQLADEIKEGKNVGFSSSRLDDAPTGADADQFLEGQNHVADTPAERAALDNDYVPQSQGEGDEFERTAGEALDDLQNQSVERYDEENRQPARRTGKTNQRQETRRQPVDDRQENEQGQEQAWDDNDPETWPEVLLRNADRLGLAPERFRSARSLGEAIVDESNRRVTQFEGGRQRQPEAEETAPAPRRAAASGKFDPFGGKREEYDETTQRIVDAQTSHYEDRIGRIEQALQSQERAAEARRFSEYDKIFRELNQTYPGMFGDGPSSRIHPDTPQGSLRVRVIRMCNAMSEGEDFTRDDFQTAAATLLQRSGVQAAADFRGIHRVNGEQQNGHDDSVARRLANRRNNALAEPMNRRSAEASTRDVGVDAVKKWLSAV